MKEKSKNRNVPFVPCTTCTTSVDRHSDQGDRSLISYFERGRELGVRATIVLYQFGQILLVLTILVERHDLILMLRQEDVFIAILLEQLAGVDEEHTRIHLGTPLGNNLSCPEKR